MQDNITNAHRLIGETIREPGDQRRGRIVGVDQARCVPAIFVIWHEQPGVQRVELAREALCRLAEACARSRSGSGRPDVASGHCHDEGLPAADTAPEPARRRVGSR